MVHAPLAKFSEQWRIALVTQYGVYGLGIVHIARLWAGFLVKLYRSATK
jgi:hypothetical protein